MKKIILGCAAVLLSLGLLAGCNNKEDEPPIEEAVVITVDSSASVVVGESLALTYTVSPEKAEVVAASDNQDIVTAVAQEGTLYLEGVAEGSAIVTLVGTYEGYASANKNISVSVITKGEEDTEPTTPETGDEGGEDEPKFESYTVELTLKTSGGAAFPDPRTEYSVWIQSDYDGTSNSDWGEEHEMTYEGEGVYTYTYEGEPGWTSETYSAGIHAGYDGAVVWGTERQFGTITIPNPTSESGAVTGQFEVTSYIGDDWETIFDFGEDVNFYLLLVDTSSTAEASVSDQGYWHTSDNATYFDNDNWCASTITTTGTTGVSCLYNATVGIAPSGTSDWFTITTDSNNWTDKIEYGTITIPEPVTPTNCEICVAYVDLSLLGATTPQSGITYNWVEATDIATYIASI